MNPEMYYAYSCAIFKLGPIDNLAASKSRSLQCDKKTYYFGKSRQFGLNLQRLYNI